MIVQRRLVSDNMVALLKVNEMKKKHTKMEETAARDKVSGSSIRYEDLSEGMQEALMNPYVSAYRKERLVYTPEFYQDMYDLIKDNQMSSVEAYKKLGFDVEVLGTDRADSAGKRARKYGRDAGVNMPKPTDFDGTVPLVEMEKKGLSKDEMYAYLKAHSMYLEVALNYYKKKLPEESSQENSSGYGSPLYRKRKTEEK